MNQNSDKNWSNLPKHIITNIGSYLPLNFQFEIRLINKHWSKVMNNVVFHSLDKFRSDDFKYIVENYGPYIKSISDTSTQLVPIQRLQQLCPKIDHLSLYLLPSALETIVQLLEAFPKISKIDIRMIMDPDSRYDSELNNIATLISQLKNLKFMSYSLTEPFDSLSERLYSLKLNTMSIVSQSYNVEEFKEFYTKSHGIRHLYYSIDYSGLDPEELQRANLITPTFLLNYNNLNSLGIWVYSYEDNEGPINDFLSKELLKLFNDSKFYNLKDFEWMYCDVDNLSPYILFTRQIPKTCQWINLSRLALFLVDRVLYGLPLTLPIYDNLNDLNSMKKLKRLFIGGFYKLAIESELTIKYLFPNVTTLNFSIEREAANEDVITDAYYIPLLFPHLSCTILKSSNCRLSKLINEYESQISWEELYIRLTDDNALLVDSLVKKLTKLKLLYIYLESSSAKVPTKCNNVRIFSVDYLSKTEFNFCIKKELE
ncbi:hypothetical protein CONCODRAFT_80420 [Conidiobolus coronatus NRRL 28638]|uniref:F-box domain-containing protein n=1 Tax=Conidiobolus coronatus (strain ATCC 28846 / CBS 209.66 / NRRL 28638) TaxID=796925 RepID=A0A137NVH8_CONC2|nr:hypothetical protein CONCODRAFT_80420 [Conidiobolus coronatus NRRL 28638]|eukprot:KXN66669.1 hypothetical protein CONCODRAFT_80420 [Conidiobolus coronatus NRRL 28638]